jgi:hypothetical protein
VTTGWGIFAGYPNPGDFSIRERTVNTYLTIHRTTGDVIIWVGRLLFGGTNGASLEWDGQNLRARNGDGFASLQGKLTTETVYSDGCLTLYDSTGRAYKVKAIPADEGTV